MKKTVTQSHREETEKAFSITSVKDKFGHDNNGLFCTIYFGGKAIAEYEFHGHGKPLIRFRSQSLKDSALEFLNKNKYVELLHKTSHSGWDLSEIDIQTQFEAIVSDAYKRKIEEKSNKPSLRKRKQNMEEFFIFVDKHTKKEIKFNLTNRTKFKDAPKEVLQRAYNKVKEIVQEKYGYGFELANTNLTQLGIKL